MHPRLRVGSQTSRFQAVLPIPRLWEPRAVRISKAMQASGEEPRVVTPCGHPETAESA